MTLLEFNMAFVKLYRSQKLLSLSKSMEQKGKFIQTGRFLQWLITVGLAAVLASIFDRSNVSPIEKLLMKICTKDEQ